MTKQISVPTIGLIAGTRMAAGIGVGFLLADRLTLEQRRAVGWALFAVGLLTTIPLVAQVVGAPGRQMQACPASEADLVAT